MSTTHEIPLIASSSVSAGAINRTADGSTFEILLEDAIEVPKGSTNCVIEVQETTIWNVVPNIITGVNDKLYFRFQGDDFVITIPQGLYDLGFLQRAIDREVEDLLGITFEGLILIEPDNPTQKTNLRLREAELRVDFTMGDTFRDLLGFNSQLVPPLPTLGVFNQLSDNVAAFNNIDFFLLHSNLTDRGIRVNNTYDSVIAQILIDVPPGSQIISRPFNAPKTGAWGLIDSSRKRIRFWLTDQDNNLVDTNTEDYSCRLIIKYDEFHDEGRNDILN